MAELSVRAEAAEKDLKWVDMMAEKMVSSLAVALVEKLVALMVA